jgi:ABC-type Fe3+/spermidine/putrescine transport system ATPase subunit
MLRCDQLSIRTGAFTLAPLSLEVPESGFQVVLGPTGSGKTLLLELLAGLRKPSQGHIWQGTREITNLPPEHRDLAYLPQDTALFPHLSVAENVYFGQRFRRQRAPAHRARVEELIDWLGLRHLLARRPAGLSGGEQQRVALIRAIASGTHTLLLDEPTAALHQTLSDEVGLMLRDLQRKLSLTVVMVTHDLASGFFLADQLSVLIQGRLQQTGAPAAVFHHPATLAVAEFLGLRNLFPAQVLTATAISCPALGDQWPLFPRSNRPALGSRGWLGLHPDGLSLLPVAASSEEIVLQGNLAEVLNKGSRVEVMVQLPAQGTQVQLQLSPHTWRQGGFAQGQPVQVAVAEHAAFWVERA